MDGSSPKPFHRNAGTVAFALLSAAVAALAGFHSMSMIDSFALVSDGRLMWRDGFHILHDNPYAPVSAPMVLQEWALSAMLAPVVDVLGWEGLGAWSSLQAVLLLASAAYMSAGTDMLRQMPGEYRIRMSLLIGLAVVCLSCTNLSARPIWLSAAIMLCEVRLVRDFCSGSGTWRAVAVMVLLIVESNFHASFIWLDFAVIAFTCLFFSEKGRLLRLAWFAACVPATLLNPYGIDALMYLPRSMSSLSGMYINEMAPLAAPDAGVSFPVMVAGLLSCALCGAAVLRHMISGGRPSREKMFFMFTAMAGAVLALLMCRNAWIPTVLAPFAVAAAIGQDRIPKIARKWFCPSAVAVCCLVLALTAATWSDENEHESTFPEAGALIGESAGVSWFDWHSTVLINQPYNGIVEALGAHVTIDTRPEIWDTVYLPGSDTSFLDDYIAMAQEDGENRGTPETMREYLEKYGIYHLYNRKGFHLISDTMDAYAEELGYELMREEPDGTEVWGKELLEASS